VIIVNGPPRAGKTSVTAELRRLVPGSVAISGDALRAFAPTDARAYLAGGATYRAAGALTRAYLELGAERVIFDYLFLRPAHVRWFREALPSDIPLKIFTLWPPLETLLERERRAQSILVAQSGPRERGRTPTIADCHREMALNLGSLGHIVDTTALDAARIARSIHEAVLA